MENVVCRRKSADVVPLEYNAQAIIGYPLEQLTSAHNTQQSHSYLIFNTENTS